ncbi:hypothetical protein HK102_000362 [Quaeritorhiza haematococci]|nr:hypothetical protein HK102_000362 [Quaeritorhiza haematococci]
MAIGGKCRRTKDDILGDMKKGFDDQCAGEELMELKSGETTNMKQLRKLNEVLGLGVSMAIGGGASRTKDDILEEMKDGNPVKATTTIRGQ